MVRMQTSFCIGLQGYWRNISWYYCEKIVDAFGGAPRSTKTLCQVVYVTIF